MLYPQVKMGVFTFFAKCQNLHYIRAVACTTKPCKLYNPPNTHLKHVLRLFSACLDKISILLNEAPKMAVFLSARRLLLMAPVILALIALTSLSGFSPLKIATF